MSANFLSICQELHHASNIYQPVAGQRHTALKYSADVKGARKTVYIFHLSRLTYPNNIRHRRAAAVVCERKYRRKERLLNINRNIHKSWPLSCSERRMMYATPAAGQRSLLEQEVNNLGRDLSVHLRPAPERSGQNANAMNYSAPSECQQGGPDSLPAKQPPRRLVLNINTAQIVKYT